MHSWTLDSLIFMAVYNTSCRLLPLAVCFPIGFLLLPIHRIVPFSDIVFLLAFFFVSHSSSSHSSSSHYSSSYPPSFSSSILHVYPHVFCLTRLGFCC